MEIGAKRGWVRGQGAVSIAVPGTILGIGLGGFVDGILLHQILQWHHMLTSTDTDNVGIEYYPADTVHGLQMNTVWDGLFHTFTWLAVLIGLGLLYSPVTHSRGRVWASRALWGWILLGWGVFNLVEGVVDHHILGIHHVRSGEYQTWWDIGFLVFGALLVAGAGSCSGTRRQWMSAIPLTCPSNDEFFDPGPWRSRRIDRVHRRGPVAPAGADGPIGRLCRVGVAVPL